MFLLRTTFPLATLALSALLSQAPAQAAQTVSASRAGQEEKSPFFRQREAVSEAIGAQRWDDAIAQARKLLQLTTPVGNPYEQMDAAELLFALLHHQGHYAEVIEVVDRMLALTRTYEDGPIAGQMDALVRRGLIEAVMVGDEAALSRYLQALRDEARLYPGLWQWDAEHRRINYLAAQMTLPLKAGRWVLVRVEPPKAREDGASFEYLYVKPDGRRVLARLRIGHDERLAGMGLQDRQKALQEERPSPDGTQDRQSGQVEQMAAPGFPDMLQIQYTTREKYGSQDLRIQHWAAMRGSWRLRVRLEMLEEDRQAAAEQLPVLWQAMRWPQAPELPVGMSQRLREVAAAWRHDADWPRAARLAAAALPDAIYPAEVASLNAVIGIAAFKAGDMAPARRALDRAAQARPYASLDSLQEDSLQYAAEIAAREGREEDAARLMRQYLRNAGGLEYRWVVQPMPQAALRNQQTGRLLPMRAAGFHLQEPRDSTRFIYRDLATEQTLGLTVDMKLPASPQQREKLLRTVLERQFRLQAGALRTMSYSPRTRDDGQRPVGEKWVFEVASGPAAGTVDLAPSDGQPAIKRAIFWIVEQGGAHTLLRASVATQQQEARAQQLADALTW